MDQSVFIHENHVQKVISDPPVATDNVRISEEGCIGVLTGKTLHVYFPRFEYMSMYQTSWLEALGPQKSDSDTAACMDPMEWLTSPPPYSLNEVGPSLLSHCFVSTHLFESNPWSVVLCSDGSIFVMKRNPFYNQERKALRMRGLHEICSCTVPKAYLLACETTASPDCTLCIAVEDDDAVVVEVRHLIVGNSGEAHLRSAQGFRCTSNTPLKCMVLHDGTLYCATESGRILLLDVREEVRLTADLTLPGTSVIVAQMAVIRGTVLVFCSSGIIALPSMTVLSSSSSADVVTSCCASDRLLLARLRGGLATHELHNDNSSLKLGPSLAFATPLSVEQTLGLAVDPSEVVCVVSSRLAPCVENTREVQLQRSLLHARTAFTFYLSPCLERDYALHLHQTVYKLIQRGLSSSPPSALSLYIHALLIGLDNIASIHSESPPAPLPQDLVDYAHGVYVEKKRVSNEPEGPDVEAEPKDLLIDSDSEDSDSSVSTQQLPQQQRPRRPAKTSKDVTPKGERETSFELTKAYEAIKSQLIPHPVKLAALGLVHVLDGSVGATLLLLSRAGPVDLQGDSVAMQVARLTAAEKEHYLLLVPGEPLQLQMQAENWRIWHYSTRALLSIRLPALPARLPALLQDVRVRLLAAHSTAAARAVLQCLPPAAAQTPALDSTWELRCLSYLVALLEMSSRKFPQFDAMDALRVLKKLVRGAKFEEEACAICGEHLAFDPEQWEASACTGCGVTTERCVFTYHLITTESHQVARCPICAAAVNLGLLQSGGALREALAGERPLCPFCKVPFLRIA